MKLTIGYFYPHLLNLYGDTGNVEILEARAKRRGFDVEIRQVTIETKIDDGYMEDLDIVMMGGGPDSSQKEMYEDLINNKGKFLKKYIEDGGVGLFVCGSYQLLGKYYKSADGSMLDGLGILDLFTEHFGNKKPRCIGNVVCELSSELRHDETFNSLNKIGATLVGFENHGGRTYLGEGMLPLAKTFKGHGNNSEDGTEGVLYKNIVGTYLHGPILSRNPHLADYLLARALNLDNLEELDDDLIHQAHTASLKLK